LTLGSEIAGLVGAFAFRIRVYNLGVLPREQVLELYKCAGALIFPSTSESFGLPLVGAAACGPPIVVEELDYVRNVVTPVETFDPESPLSIARMVRRFLGCPETPGPLMTTSEFLERILRL
jgi:glycosyltransferase involved in cell wall biosynthesis